MIIYENRYRRYYRKLGTYVIFVFAKITNFLTTCNLKNIQNQYVVI